MEVSSHALALGRVYGLHFHTAVFTNLTRDHLDFHRTMEDYFAAKQIAVRGRGRRRRRAYAVINRDDDYGSRSSCTRKTGSALVRTGQRSAIVRARHISSGLAGAALRRAVRQAALRRWNRR